MAFLIGNPIGGSTKTAVLWIPNIKESPRKPYQNWSLVCFGAMRHYRKDGSCAHTAAVIDRLTPWYRSRTHLTPFGDKKRTSNE
jgi:hypothetical protein